jgi:N6-adenosine-specific RNA methylase IME4
MDIFFDNEFRNLIPALQPDEREHLETSLKTEGNRDPIIIWKENQLLLDGHNRYDICTQNNIPLKPANELSFPDRNAAMVWIIQNQFGRRNLQVFSRGVLALKLEGLLKEQAKTRQGTRTDLIQNIPPMLAGSSRDRETREIVAKTAHVSHGTLDKIKILQEKATPKQKEELVKGSKTVNQVYVAVRRDEVKEQVKKTEWPTGKYRVIYADPPWQYSNNISADKFNDVELHYPSMPLNEICELPVSDMALDNSVLFLWVTAPFLEDSFKVINAWGFKYKTCFVWDKLVKTYGHYSGVRHELVLVAVKGSCQPDISLQPDSVFSIKKTEHSAKPEEFRQTIDSLYPHGPRIELFARTKAPGWEVWGNEIK